MAEHFKMAAQNGGSSSCVAVELRTAYILDRKGKYANRCSN